MTAVELNRKRASAEAVLSSAEMPAWYALAVRVRSEHAAGERLRRRFDDVFVPARSQRRAWTDRVVTAQVPLFPGYVFVRTALTSAQRVALLRDRAVNALVGIADSAGTRTVRAVPDLEIEALRLLVSAERALDPVERLTAGRHVIVAAGPLRGVRGIVVKQADGQRRLVVQITMLGRGVRTTLGADDVVERPESDA